MSPEKLAEAILDGAERMKVDLRSTLDIDDEAFETLQLLASPDRWEVFDNVTGVAISKPYPKEEWASSVCASYNTPTSGGRYGVRAVLT